MKLISFTFVLTILSVSCGTASFKEKDTKSTPTNTPTLSCGEQDSNCEKPKLCTQKSQDTSKEKEDFTDKNEEELCPDDTSQGDNPSQSDNTSQNDNPSQGDNPSQSFDPSKQDNPSQSN